MTAFIIYLMRIRYLLSFITAVIALVLGIIVTVNKLKQTKILGFSVIFTAVSGIISSLYLYLVNYRGIWEVANLNKLHTVLVLAFSLAGLYFICLYVHRNYHYKFIYFPVLIVPVVERIANLISNRLVFTLSSPYTEYYVLTSRVQIAQNITSLVVSTIIFFILFIVFYLNKKNEKFIPHYYVICLITLIWRVINHGFAALYHLIISLDATAWFDANTVADFMYDNGYYITVFFTVLGAFVTLIFPVYLLIRVIKASRKEDDEQEVMLVGEIEMPSVDEPS